MCVLCVCVCVPAEPVAWSSLCIPLTTHLHRAGVNEGNHPGDQLWEEMTGREKEQWTWKEKGEDRRRNRRDRKGTCVSSLLILHLQARLVHSCTTVDFMHTCTCTTAVERERSV